MSAKQAINDKLQGSVDAYLRCGRVVHNQIKKWLTAESGSNLKKIFAKVASKNVIVSCTFFVFQQCVSPARINNGKAHIGGQIEEQTDIQTDTLIS